MNSVRWSTVQAIFHGALDRPEAERERFLIDRCGSDDTLRADVAAMLEEDARGSSVLDRGLPLLADALLVGSDGTGLVGRRLGPYDLTSVLGEGGMGVVYRAEHVDWARPVAVKIVRGGWSPSRAERFAFEARTLARLAHPAIATLFDSGSLADGTPWFAMELVEGLPITEYCRRRRSGLTERLALFRNVCVAVRHAHQLLIVHRDLKPSNVFVTADGSVKLLDFGIAKQLEPDEGGTPGPGETIVRLMTPVYAAPEQFTGGRVGLHTDVYALGVLLYELLAGRPPFDLSERTPAQAEAVILDGRVAPVSRVSGRVTASRASWADLDVLCRTAMHRDPTRRYGSVDALIGDLDRFVAGAPLEARPDSWRYRAGKFVRRHWRPLGLAAAVLCMVGALSAVYVGQITTARRTAEAQAARAARIQRFMLNLFDGGDPAAGPADDLKVVTLLDRGALEAQGLAAEPVVQADLRRTLGTLYQRMGRFDQADAMLALALEGFRAQSGASSVEVGETLTALALLRIDQARLDDAEAFVAQARQVLTGREGLAAAAAAEAVAAQARLLEARGDYPGAISASEEAVRQETALGVGRPSWIEALAQLADSHYYAGHYEEADRLNVRVLAATRATYGEHHPRVADVLINVGASYTDRGDYQKAEAAYRPALEILRGHYGPEHYRTASAETMLGRALMYEKRRDEARALLDHALAVQEAVNGPEHPRVASALNDLGAIALQAGQYDEAASRFSRMIEIYRAVYGGEHYLLATALSNLGSVEIERQAYDRAEVLYREALAMFIRVQSPTHLNVGIAHLKLGRALLRQRRFGAAEAETRAGYELLKAQATPSLGFLAAARTDLIAEYDGLGRPTEAAAVRAEQQTAGQVR